mgnify:CR=1 FL=1
MERIDAADVISEQDSAIAGYILEAGRALVIALNKWDAVPADDTSRPVPAGYDLVGALASRRDRPSTPAFSPRDPGPEPRNPAPVDGPGPVREAAGPGADAAEETTRPAVAGEPR